MSAPDTNIERETRRHAPSLLGIGLAVLVGLIMGAAIMYTAVGPSSRAEMPTQSIAPDVGTPSTTPATQ